MSIAVNANVNPIELTIRALGQLSLSSKSTVIALFKQLAYREGIRVTMTGTTGIQTPIDSIPLCLAKQIGTAREQSICMTT
jgi:hypothetical protein